MRLLVTGSREWTDVEAVRRALLEHGPGVVVHGGARGLDEVADRVAAALGWPSEAHPADWRKHGRAAGVVRNQRMIDAGAELCLAFPMPGSRGTYDCAARAVRAGIPLVWVLPPGLTEQQAEAELVAVRGTSF